MKSTVNLDCQRRSANFVARFHFWVLAWIHVVQFEERNLHCEVCLSLKNRKTNKTDLLFSTDLQHETNVFPLFLLELIWHSTKVILSWEQKNAASVLSVKAYQFHQQTVQIYFFLDDIDEEFIWYFIYLPACYKSFLSIQYPDLRKCSDSLRKIIEDIPTTTRLGVQSVKLKGNVVV